MCWLVAPSTLPRFTPACGPRKKLRLKGFRQPPAPSDHAAAARLAGEFKRDYARKGTTLNLGDVIIAAVHPQRTQSLLFPNSLHAERVRYVVK